MRFLNYLLLEAESYYQLAFELNAEPSESLLCYAHNYNLAKSINNGFNSVKYKQACATLWSEKILNRRYKKPSINTLINNTVDSLTKQNLKLKNQFWEKCPFVQHSQITPIWSRLVSQAQLSYNTPAKTDIMSQDQTVRISLKSSVQGTQLFSGRVSETYPILKMIFDNKDIIKQLKVDGGKAYEFLAELIGYDVKLMNDNFEKMKNNWSMPKNANRYSQLFSQYLWSNAEFKKFFLTEALTGQLKYGESIYVPTHIGIWHILDGYIELFDVPAYLNHIIEKTYVEFSMKSSTSSNKGLALRIKTRQ